jgi:hypothetical protein
MVGFVGVRRKVLRRLLFTKTTGIGKTSGLL